MPLTSLISLVFSSSFYKAEAVRQQHSQQFVKASNEKPTNAQAETDEIQLDDDEAEAEQADEDQEDEEGDADAPKKSRVELEQQAIPAAVFGELANNPDLGAKARFAAKASK